MIEVTADGSPHSGWTVKWSTKRQLAHSTSTRFWNTNASSRIIEFDTLNSDSDTVVILKANTTANDDGVLDSNRNYDVLGTVLVEQDLPNAGLPDIHKLSVVPEDLNGDGIPDNLLQPILFDYEVSQRWDEYVLVTEVATDDAIDILNSTNVATNKQIGRDYITGAMDADMHIYVNDVLVTNADADVVYPSGSEVFATRIIFTAIPDPSDIVRIEFADWVYQARETDIDAWYPILATDEIRTLWAVDQGDDGVENRYKRDNGRYPLNFAWFHYTPRLHLVDPAASNIVDIYIVTIAYYLELVRWLENRIDNEPDQPTPLQLRNAYADLLDNKMISDTVVLHPGAFKILFGSRAPDELQCYFSVIRPVASSLTDNEVKVRIVDIIRTFFDINTWEFGETFFYTEMSAAIHAELGPEIDSIVLVPTSTTNIFGDLFQIQSKEDEVFIPDINTENITIVQSYTPENIRQSS